MDTELTTWIAWIGRTIQELEESEEPSQASYAAAPMPPADSTHDGLSGGDPFSDDGFNTRALELFSLQYRLNETYRRWCNLRGVHQGVVNHWSEIPVLPVEMFKEFTISCLPPSHRISCFCSSGTTGMLPGRHWHGSSTLALYEASLKAGFRRVIRRIAAGRESCNATGMAPRLISLTPGADACPSSSLVHMFQVLGEQYDGSGMGFTGEIGQGGEWVLNLKDVRVEIRRARDLGQPLWIFGTAFNWVHLMDAIGSDRDGLQLVSGSLVFETGGYKGRSREVPAEELARFYVGTLKVQESHIVREYGMCELSSQAYETRNTVGTGNDGGTPSLRGGGWVGDRDGLRVGNDGGTSSPPRTSLAGIDRDGLFSFPAWVRVRVVSAETGRVLPDGHPGVLQVFDLANAGSVLGVQTADVGVMFGREFRLQGRVTGAEPRGCSLRSLDLPNTVERTTAGTAAVTGAFSGRGAVSALETQRPAELSDEKVRE